jgi:ferritin-like metal-binding protein YciE
MLIGVGALWLALSNDRPPHLTDSRRTRRTGHSREGKTLMAVSRDNLTAWLRDAHAMENQAIEILEKQANRLEHYPELCAKVRTHLEETHSQAERVERCLHQLGTDTSTLKTAAGKMIRTAQQLSGLFASDEVLKSGIADYAFEHYEIASYKMLVAAAAEAGEHEVERSLEETLREEEAMAAWLSQHLREVTRQYLHREAAGAAGQGLRSPPARSAGQGTAPSASPGRPLRGHARASVWATDPTASAAAERAMCSPPVDEPSASASVPRGVAGSSTATLSPILPRSIRSRTAAC